MPFSVLTFLVVALSPAVQAVGSDNAIHMMCMVAFDSAMHQAGKTPPAGMGDFTCDCFLRQVEQVPVLTLPRAPARAGCEEKFL